MAEKLFISVCNSQEMVHSDWAWSMLYNMRNEYAMEIYRSKHPWTIVRNNRAIWRFLESSADIFVKMDCDQVYPMNYFESMVPLVERYKVIGPVIYDRWSHNEYRTLVFEDKDDLYDNWVDVSEECGVCSYPYTHTNNFYAREVWENIAAPWYESRTSDDGLDKLNHVDFDVLDKVKAAGYEIWLNQDVTVGHISSTSIDQEFYRRLKREIV